MNLHNVDPNDLIKFLTVLLTAILLALKYLRPIAVAHAATAQKAALDKTFSVAEMVVAEGMREVADLKDVSTNGTWDAEAANRIKQRAEAYVARLCAAEIQKALGVNVTQEEVNSFISKAVEAAVQKFKALQAK